MYVPKNKKILARTKLLKPGDRAVLTMTVPKKPGEYEYVCTYPEPWRAMYGQLLVVKDAEALAKAATRPSPPQPTAESTHDHASGYE